MMFSNIFKSSVFIFLIVLCCHISDVRGVSIADLKLKNQTDSKSQSNAVEETTDAGFVTDATADVTGKSITELELKKQTDLGFHESQPTAAATEVTTTVLPITADVTGKSITELELKNQTDIGFPESQPTTTVLPTTADPNDFCNEHYPKCLDTGGYCQDTLGTIYCECPYFTLYEQDQGCISKPEVCYILKENCDETGGICVADKSKRLQCRCPENTVYDDDVGCRIPSCSRQYPLCEETYGICTLDRNKEIQCKCPQSSEYVYGVGCRVLEDVCSKHRPFCKETRGKCMFGDNGEIECRCPGHIEYQDKAGCQDVCRCRNGGICKLDQGKKKCFCKEPYTGKFCDDQRVFTKNVLYILTMITLSSCFLISCCCVVYLRIRLGRKE